MPCDKAPNPAPVPPRGAIAEMRNVYLLLMEQFVLPDAVGPQQAFAAANEILARSGAPQAYRLGLYAARAGATISSSGPAMWTEGLPETVPSRRGTVFLIGGLAPVPGGAARLETSKLQAWLRRHAPRFERRASIGQAAAVLAHQAGSSDRPPGCRWIVVDNTEATTTALAMIERDMGSAMALAIARQLAAAFGLEAVLAQGIARTLAPTDARLDRLHQWMGKRLSESITVQSMATYLAMTPRTFARFYRRATGTTPARDVVRMRLEKACWLLATEWSTLKAVAHACGFSSEEVMRRTFLRHLHVSPKAYRQRLRQTPSDRKAHEEPPGREP